MKLSRLVLAILIAVIAFWLLGLVLKVALWLLNILLFIGLILVIFVLLERYSENRTKRH